MATTIKRVTIALTKEDLRLLERACKIVGETPSDILKRGLVLINNLLKRSLNMRASITFDTLEYMDELKRSGMRQEEAEAITKATAKAFSQMLETKEIATKKDLKEMEINLKKDIHFFEVAVKNDIQELKSETIKFIHENTWKTVGIIATFQTITLGIFGLVQYLIK